MPNGIEPNLTHTHQKCWDENKLKHNGEICAKGESYISLCEEFDQSIAVPL